MTPGSFSPIRAIRVSLLFDAVPPHHLPAFPSKKAHDAEHGCGNFQSVPILTS
jgi:hypothetical protein